MFGYIQVNFNTLDEADKQRFRACYCGLCRVLGEKYGDAGRLTLSNDMTFLSMLLSALYEPEEISGQRRCPLHMIKPRPYVRTEATVFAADMNILLAYYKCLDDREDERSLKGKIGLVSLSKAFEQVKARYPGICQSVSDALTRLHRLESENSDDMDALARLSGQMLSACFVWREDVFAGALRDMGAALGRFIYLMDAYEDYDEDKKHKRFNPLSSIHDLPDFEERMSDIFSLEMSQCVRAFDFLPIEQDVSLLRNILYSGVWSRYAVLQQKRKDKKQ